MPQAQRRDRELVDLVGVRPTRTPLLRALPLGLAVPPRAGTRSPPAWPMVLPGGAREDGDVGDYRIGVTSDSSELLRPAPRVAVDMPNIRSAGVSGSSSEQRRMSMEVSSRGTDRRDPDDRRVAEYPAGKRRADLVGQE